MCGLAGLLAARLDPETGRRFALAAARSMHRRGPDANGLFVDGSIALGHARLAVLELSEAGAQPMRSPDGRFALVFNGEIYNHAALRPELVRLGAIFRGRSDTETLLWALALWGVAGALPKLRGMFAFAFWDRAAERLVLAVDSLAKKPLYYGLVGENFVFASELKAFKAAPGFVPRLDDAALALFLRYGFIPTPDSIFEGIRKLEPGNWLETGPGRETTLRRWWDWTATALRSSAFSGDDDEAADRLEAALAASVADRLVADRPLGVLLSGGIDSSLVAALAKESANGPIRTFTVGFRDADFDESRHAERIAALLGTEHETIRLDPRDALDGIPNLPEIADEPFADSSLIPTHLVCRAAKDRVTVLLSGDGGDEALMGYNRHVAGPGLFRFMRGPLGSAAALLIRAFGPLVLGDCLARLTPKTRRVPQLGLKLQKLLDAADSRDEADFHARLLRLWPKGCEPAVPRPETDPLDRFFAALPDCGAGLDFARLSRLADLTVYLPADILVKLDRASMAASVEARSPFLDERVLELGLSFPTERLVRGGRGKLPARTLLARRLPTELFERPKQGFGIPLAGWLRGPLRDWAAERVARLADSPRFAGDRFAQAWTEHLAGRADHSHRLWTGLVLADWAAYWGLDV